MYNKIKKYKSLAYSIIAFCALNSSLESGIHASASHQSLCVQITVPSLQSNRLGEVNQQLSQVCSWLEAKKSEQNSTSYQNALISISSHAFLYTYAEALSSLHEASQDTLVKRVMTLWGALGTIPAPISEIPLIKGSDEEKFAKISRGLFQEFDRAVDRLTQSIKPGIKCASSIVEWAVNVIPGFELEKIKGEKEHLTPDHIIQAIKKNYSQQNLKKYLEGGWPYIYQNIINQKNNKPNSDVIFRQLDTTLCYPGVKDMPIASSLLPISSGKSSASWGEVFAREKAMNYFDKFVLERCRHYNPTVTQRTLDYKCGEHEKQFCANFWTDLANSYEKHLAEGYDITALKSSWSSSKVKQEFINHLTEFGTTSEELCP